MKKEELNKIEYAITFKKRNSRPQKSLVFNNQNKQPDKQSSEAANKNKINYGSQDGKSDTNKSSKQRKSLPTLSIPSSSNPIRKMMAQRALYDYMKNVSTGNNFQDRQTLHQQTISLKLKNNELSVQNMKLKTRVMSLESDNLKMQKIIDEDSDIKYPGIKQSKIKSNQQTINSLKIILRDSKKELADLRQENNKIKKTLKYTRISEMEHERKTLQQQTVRLRQLLEQQVAENLNYKTKSYNKSQLQQECTTLQHANINLKKEMVEYSKKVKTMEQKLKGIKAEPDRNMNKTITDLKKTVKEKNIEIDNLKKAKEEHPKEERGAVRSASLNKGKVGKLKCQQCNSKKQQIKNLKAKIQQLLEKLKQSNGNNPSFQEIIIKPPTLQQLKQASEFLRYRFKAHHLSYQNLEKYLIKVDSVTVSVGAMVQNLLAEPFFLIHPIYLENIIAYLFYSDRKQQEITVNESFEKSASQIKSSFLELIQPYQLMEGRKEEEIFIQIAQIVTNYCDHISAAFDSKRNGQGTISKSSLYQFLQHIELQQQYIQFIITQIVLESTDLDHLNYYSLFQIFYLPNNNVANMPEAVKELDEEYQESQQSGRIKGVDKDGLIEIDDDLEYEQDFDLKEGENDLQEIIPEQKSV